MSSSNNYILEKSSKKKRIKAKKRKRSKQLYPALKNTKNGELYGYINNKGKYEIEPKFKIAYDFNESCLAIINENDKYGVIDLKGEYKVYPIYDSISYFKGDMTVFGGVIDIEGNEIIKPKFTSESKFIDGMAIISIKENYNGPYGVINKKGEYIFTPIFSEVRYLGEDRLALGMPIGKPLGDDKFVAPSIFAIGDINGNILTEFKYYAVGNYDKGVAYASNNNCTFFIDKSGKVINLLPKVKGSGELKIKDGIIYANIDYSPYYLTRSGKVIYKPNDEIILDNKYSIIKEKYKPNFNFLIYTPQIKGIKNRRIQKRVNSKLKTLSYFKPFAEEQISHNINENDVLDYSYYGTFEVTFLKKDILILSLTGYYYPLGAAHGLSSKITPVINLDTGEFYTLEDLFKSGTAWKDRLNSIIRIMIDEDKQYEYIYKDGFKGINEGQNFYFDDDNLYIYFQPYDIGPHSEGFITFKIPFTSVEDIIEKFNICWGK